MTHSSSTRPSSTRPSSRPRLRRGDALPKIVTLPPGPESRRLCQTLRQTEAPGINTLYQDRDTLVWHEARGANVLDVDGNRYLDFTAGFGVASLGHRHPRVVAAVRQQSGRLLHGLGDVAAHPSRIALAQRLATLAPVDDPRVHFAVSGADAVEVAIKTAWLATGRKTLLVFDPSYHGLTLGALAASSRPAFRRPFAEQLHPHLVRRPFGLDPKRLASDFENRRGGERLAAVVLEPIVGREGILVPPEGWLSELAELCRRHEIPLLVDEIFTGFGRTGHRFAVDAEGVHPDLLCCGKALGGGLPIAAVVGRRALMDHWRTDGEALHTGTFVAHPVACAAALASLEVLEDDALAERAARLGRRVATRLTGWERFDCVAAVRGRGMLHGLELDRAETAAALMERCWQSGLLILAGGPEGKVAQIVPPLTITRRQLDHGLDLLESVLASLANDSSGSELAGKRDLAEQNAVSSTQPVRPETPTHD